MGLGCVVLGWVGLCCLFVRVGLGFVLFCFAWFGLVCFWGVVCFVLIFCLFTRFLLGEDGMEWNFEFVKTTSHATTSTQETG